MWDQISRLHELHGEVPAEFSVLKLTEEVGEAAAALIGVTGMNKRKGVTSTLDDVLDELADVIITAAVAMSDIAGSADQARAHFDRSLLRVLTRSGLGGE